MMPAYELVMDSVEKKLLWQLVNIDRNTNHQTTANSNSQIRQDEKKNASAKSFLSSSSSAAAALPPITLDQVKQHPLDHYDMNGAASATSFYDSFFGVNELERYFPEHKLRLAVVTWNMSSKAPTDYNKTLQALLHLSLTDVESDQKPNLPELYVLGFQETPTSETVLENIKTGIQATLGPNYVLLRWSAIGSLHVSIWIRRELLWSCTSVQIIPIHSRPVAANRIRTKGAISMSFRLFGTTFLFINTHLSAHETNLRTRMNQLDKVQQILNIWPDETARESYFFESSDPSQAATLQHFPSEYTFWFGDLNFRLELPFEIVIDAIKRIIEADNLETKSIYMRKLIRSDQLSNLMLRGIIFKQFQEALWPPSFLPTFKCKIQSRSQNIISSVTSQQQRSLARVGSLDSNNSASQFSINSASSASVSSTQNQEKAYLTSSPPPPLPPPPSQYNRFDEKNEYFDYEPVRVPSYTDRILYQSRSSNVIDQSETIKCLFYNSIPELTSSDHKPVFAMFEVTLEPSAGTRDFVPSTNNRLSQLVDQLTMKQKDKNNLNRIWTNTQRTFFNRRHKNLANNTRSLRSLPIADSTPRLDRVSGHNLNAGAFERKVYINGLKIRNNLLQQSASMEEIKKPRLSATKRTELFKSHSFDSNIVEHINQNDELFVKQLDEQELEKKNVRPLATEKERTIASADSNCTINDKASKVCSVT